MLNVKKVNDYIQERILEVKNKTGVAAIILNSICDIPTELLTTEEEKAINKVLCSLLKSNGYITKTRISDFYNPNDFCFKNKGYLIIL